MTKAKLLELLAPFADDAYVGIRLYGDYYDQFGGAMVFIQDVLSAPSPASPTKNAHLLAHARNKILVSEERERFICDVPAGVPSINAYLREARAKLESMIADTPAIRPTTPAKFTEPPLSMADGLHGDSDADTFRTRGAER